jgi:hypothetical protein
MISVPAHKKNSKIGEDIRREKGNHIIILREGNSFFLEKVKNILFSRTLIAGLLVASLVLYTSKTPFLKAETTIFYPKACLGGFEGVSLAEGEPETKIDSDSSAFDKENSAYLSKDQSAEMYCGDFDGEVLEHTTPKDVVLTIFLGTRESTETIIKSQTTENTPTFLEVLDAKGIPTLENGQNSSSSPNIPVGVVAEPEDGIEEAKVLPQEEKPAQDMQQSSELPPEAFLQKLVPITLFFSQKAFAEELAEPQVVAENKEEKKIEVEETAQAPVNEVKISESEQKNAYELLVMPRSDDPKIESLIPEIVSESIPEKKDELKEGELLSDIVKVLSNEKISSNNSSSTESPLYEVSYSIGGDEWIGLASLGNENTKTVSLQLSGFSSWSEIGKLQVKVKSLGTLDQKDNLYVDGMALVIHYEKDVVTEREYVISDIENTSEKLTVSAKGEKGEARLIVMIAKEEAGLAVYNVDTKALVLTTQVQAVNESYFDPNALFPEYGSYALVLNNDAGWCGSLSLSKCLEGEDFLSVSFLAISPSLKSKESVHIKNIKDDLKKDIVLLIKDEVKDEEGSTTRAKSLLFPEDTTSNVKLEEVGNISEDAEPPLESKRAEEFAPKKEETE